MNSLRYFFIGFVLYSSWAGTIFAQVITPIADINVVDENGNPTFPGLQTTERYTIEGIALNDAGVFNRKLETGAFGSDFILFVQDQTGGIQVYSGGWYGGGLANYPTVKRGDRVRVTGMTGHFGGKTNINERHNPDQRFEIQVFSQNNQVTPLPITDLSEVAVFDPTRQSGGEYYQGRLVVLKSVSIMEGTWEHDSVITVADSLGNQFPVQLWAASGIADHPQPVGLLDITGIFNQEDTEQPFTEGYLLWPRSIDDFRRAATSGLSEWNVYP